MSGTVGRLRGDGRGWTLLAVSLGWVFVLGGRFLLPPVLPQVKTAFGVGDFAVGVALTAIWGAYALVQSPAGLLIDRLGERRLLTGSLLLSAATVAWIGASPVFLVFLVGCVAFGTATGAYAPPQETALSRTFPDDDTAAIGVSLAAGSLGAAVLPFLAGALADTVGWRTVAVALAPPFLVLAATTWRRVPEREQVAQPDRLEPRRLAREVTRALRAGPVLLVGGALSLVLFAFQGVSAFYVTYLTTAKPLDQTTAAGLFALVSVGGAVAQLAGGDLADRFGERATLVGMAAVAVPALLAVPAVDGPFALAALSFALGVQLGIAPVANAYVIAVLPDAVTGTAWGLLRTAFFLLGAVGSSAVGAMADRGLFDESFVVLAAVTALAAACYRFVPPREAAAMD